MICTHSDNTIRNNSPILCRYKTISFIKMFTVTNIVKATIIFNTFSYPLEEFLPVWFAEVNPWIIFKDVSMISLPNWMKYSWLNVFGNSAEDGQLSTYAGIADLPSVTTFTKIPATASQLLKKQHYDNWPQRLTQKKEISGLLLKKTEISGGTFFLAYELWKKLQYASDIHIYTGCLVRWCISLMCFSASSCRLYLDWKDNRSPNFGC